MKKNLIVYLAFALVLSTFAVLCGCTSSDNGSNTDGNNSTGTDTTAPSITGVSHSQITVSGATINWTTDEVSTSQVEYGRTTSYGSSTVSDSTMVTSHVVSISGLTSGNTYHYRVKSTDASNNQATSGDNTFTLPAPSDTTAPIISNVVSSGLTTSGTTITWSTDEASTSQVEYGTTAGYGSTSVLDTTLVTAHTAILSGLNSGIMYHFRVKSRDAAGNVASSDDKTFNTIQAQPALEILSHSHFMDSIGSYHVVGEVQNNSSNKLDFVKVTGTFYNASGTVVDTDFTYTMIDTLLPGQKSPFEIFVLEESISATVDHYTVAVSDWDTTSEEPYRGFSILSQSTSTDVLGARHVVGEVKNTGTQEATYVQVVATFYDASGKVVAAEFTYTDPSTLVAGQTAPFEVIVLSATQSTKIATYELQVQS